MPGAGTALYGTNSHTQWYSLRRLRRGERAAGSVRIALTCLHGRGAPSKVSPIKPTKDTATVNEKSGAQQNGTTNHPNHNNNVRQKRRTQTRASTSTSANSSAKTMPFLKRKSRKVQSHKVDWSKVQSRTNSHRTARQQKEMDDERQLHNFRRRRQQSGQYSPGASGLRHQSHRDRRSYLKAQLHRDSDEEDTDSNTSNISGQQRTHRRSEIPRWNGHRWQRGGSTPSERSQSPRHAHAMQPEDQDDNETYDDYLGVRQSLFPSTAPPVTEGSFYGDDVETIDGNSSDDGSVGVTLPTEEDFQVHSRPLDGTNLDDSYELYKDFPDDYDDNYDAQEQTDGPRPVPEPTSTRHDPHSPDQQQTQTQTQTQIGDGQRLRVEELETLFDHLTMPSADQHQGATYADSVD